MLVVHSDKMGITNLNAIVQIKLIGKYIHAYSVSESHVIARYDTEERAEDVFKILTNQCRLTKGDDVILLPEE